MPMSRLSHMTRTTAARGNVVMNASGTFPIPYGRGALSITGRGASGAAASGGDYWYDNSSYDPGNPTPAYYASGNPTTPTYVAGNTNPSTYTPGNSNSGYSTPGNPGPAYNYIDVDDYYYDNLNTEEYTNSFTSNTCPAHTGNVKVGHYYSCTPQTIYAPPNSPTYVPGNTNPANYTAGTNNSPYYNSNPPNPDYFTNNPPNSPSYYAGNVEYTPYVPATTGAPASFGGQTFPGGYAGAAAPVTVTVYIPFSNAGAPATVPTNASLSITTIS